MTEPASMENDRLADDLLNGAAEIPHRGVGNAA
jgi:hypothetical protein